jgi:hypothetical protein
LQWKSHVSRKGTASAVPQKAAGHSGLSAPEGNSASSSRTSDAKRRFIPMATPVTNLSSCVDTSPVSAA